MQFQNIFLKFSPGFHTRSRWCCWRGRCGRWQRRCYWSTGPRSLESSAIDWSDIFCKSSLKIEFASKARLSSWLMFCIRISLGRWRSLYLWRKNGYDKLNKLMTKSGWIIVNDRKFSVSVLISVLGSMRVRHVLSFSFDLKLGFGRSLIVSIKMMVRTETRKKFNLLVNESDWTQNLGSCSGKDPIALTIRFILKVSFQQIYLIYELYCITA